MVGELQWWEINDYDDVVWSVATVELTAAAAAAAGALLGDITEAGLLAETPLLDELAAAAEAEDFWGTAEVVNADCRAYTKIPRIREDPGIIMIAPPSSNSPFHQQYPSP